VAVNFTSSSDYLSTAISVPPTSDFTFMGWVNISATNGTRPLVSVYGFSGSNYVTLELCLFGSIHSSIVYLQLGIIVNGTNYLFRPALQTIYANKWTHIAGTIFSGGTANSHLVRIYQNGVSMPVSAAVNPNVQTFPYTFTEAYVNNSAPALTNGPIGSVAELRVWTRALSASEVWREYRSAVPIAPGLLIYSPFKTDNYTDKSGNGYVWVPHLPGGDGTIVSGPNTPHLPKSARI
jgi:hypothetical protein